MKEKLTIDISSLLFPSNKIDFEMEFDRLKTMEIHFLKFKIECETPMLSPFLRKKLNPLQINVVAGKDIPYKTEPKYKPIYAICRFVDDNHFATMEMPQQPMCKWMHKHVFLIGQHDPVSFKEMLATKLVRVELHDCDEYMHNEEEEAKFSFGCAKFTIKDFLRPNCRELKLRSDVFPVKRELIDNTNNLDLNTTARKNER